ncbi:MULTISPECIES: 50S ribosomal protein L24 [Holospora]|uniref:Large ribosomal subunit protein uL24 n=2 Tax=Holospora TaxID=44747 RepID=A0A061JIC6_9PROT|nr:MULTISPECIES: 50S ribosomal protein L24 [Holospora]ETZ04764.1 50S ribosomal protein L24 [Holospora undulata HU1]GAJ46028.1 50S ribosomal protein L24 [Holospora elegans E1]
MKDKCKIKKGDIVVLISGRDKGIKGAVLEIDYTRQRVLVENSGEVLRHTKPSSKYPDGGIVKKNLGVHWSNVMILDPAFKDSASEYCSREVLTRIGFKFDEKGEKFRYAKRSGEFIGRVR